MYPHLSTWRPIATVAALVLATTLATSIVTVESGDTLSTIAARNDVTVAQLAEWNDIDDPNRIFAGSTLVVSPPDDAISVGPTGAVHVVTAGETLFAIASRFGVAVAEIVSTNGLDNPDRIFIGQELALSSSPTPADTAAPSSPRSHTVAPGETLGEIAARYGLRTDRLAADNSIDDPDRIRIGSILTIGEVVQTPAPPPGPDPAPQPTSTPPGATVAPGRSGQVLLVPLFAEWSDVYDVPRDVLEAIAWHESGWNPDLVGADGAMGLTQLSPDRVSLLEGGLLGRDLDPLDPGDAVEMSARYLRYLIDRTHSERAAIAAWQQGLASIQSDGLTTDGAQYVDAVEEIRRLRS